MTRWHQAPAILVAAERWKDRCLLHDGSVFTDGHVWTRENLDALDRYFVQNLDYGEGDFYSKLQTQLAPAPTTAKYLAAEMLWVMFLFISEDAMGAATKRLQIKNVWEWSGTPLPVSDALDKPMEVGVGRPGTAYFTHRWRELVFFIDAMRAWKTLSDSQRRRVLGDPWEFASWLESIPSSRNRQLREILLYLLFPDTFERMATGRDKRAVIRAFLEKEGRDPDEFNYEDRIQVDREVKRIREKWEASLGGEEFDFYRRPAKLEWQNRDARPAGNRRGDTLEAVTFDQPSPWFDRTFGAAHVWVIAAGSGGRWWPDFQKDGVIAIGTQDLGDLAQYATREEIREEMVQVGQLDRDPIHDSLAAWNFAKVMKPGDHVFATAGRRTLLGHGVVSSDYSYDEDRPEAQHVRAVEWKHTGRWDIPEEYRISGKTLTDFEPYKEWLQMAWGLIYERTAPASSAPKTRYTVEDAIADVFLPQDTFQRIVDVLAAKKNVILEGAPGVGKTFVARRIAWALMRGQDPSRLEMVQFHQSYAYEDFVQGWRPDGKGFRLQNGVFYRFCERARENPEEPYVFIIDEINRGNLSKVLGELMMLIEADKRGDDFAIPLTYSQDGNDRFSVPANVHILGLMNTADRSLAMVDYALRRRFAFFRLEPAFESEAFAEVLTKRGVSENLVDRIRKGMATLNKEIAEDRNSLGPGFEVGHSFFVPTDDTSALDESWYAGVIRGEIEPLLREYWFDQPERVVSAVKALLT